MKFFQMLFFLILFQSVSSASYLLDTTNPLCIEDFYYKDSKLYFLDSKTNSLFFSTQANSSSLIKVGYVYDSLNDACKPDVNLILGMDIKDFNFLLGLMGVIIGGIFMFFTTQIFMVVGGKR